MTAHISIAARGTAQPQTQADPEPAAALRLQKNSRSVLLLAGLFVGFAAYLEAFFKAEANAQAPEQAKPAAAPQTLAADATALVAPEPAAAVDTPPAGAKPPAMAATAQTAAQAGVVSPPQLAAPAPFPALPDHAPPHTLLSDVAPLAAVALPKGSFIDIEVPRVTAVTGFDFSPRAARPPSALNDPAAHPASVGQAGVAEPVLPASTAPLVSQVSAFTVGDLLQASWMQDGAVPALADPAARQAMLGNFGFTDADPYDAVPMFGTDQTAPPEVSSLAFLFDPTL